MSSCSETPSINDDYAPSGGTRKVVEQVSNIPVGSKNIVSFKANDLDNPFNWSMRKKLYIVTVGFLAILNSTFDSSLPSGAIGFITTDFHVDDPIQYALPISVYLVGYIFGPLLFAPLSETYGRRIVLVPTFALFTIFTMACALAPSWPAFLVFRLICGVNASSSIAIVSGLYADIFEDPAVRGRAIAFYTSASTVSPQLAPLVSGAVCSTSWRWTFWIGLIVAGVSFVPILFMPETFKPIILRNRARKIRELTPGSAVYALIELEKRDTREMVTIILARPVRMLFEEPIVLFSSLYIAVACSIYFLLFEAYPLIFQGRYGMNHVGAGLSFLPVAIGAVLAFPITLLWDAYFRRAVARQAAWTAKKENHRLPLACIGSILYVVSLFWLGWTSSPSIHWIVPMLAGAPFGAGYVLIFTPLLNYMTDAYGQYAASAAAAASCVRSILSALLPLAAQSMYKKLGIEWGMSLLGLLSLGLGIVPFAFIWYGEQIRGGSRLCQSLARDVGECGLEQPMIRFRPYLSFSS